MELKENNAEMNNPKINIEGWLNVLYISNTDKIRSIHILFKFFLEKVSIHIVIFLVS